MVRLVLEIAPEDFEAVCDQQMLAFEVHEIELRQEDGVLACAREVGWLEGLGSFALKDHGLDQGPAIRVFFAPREE